MLFEGKAEIIFRCPLISFFGFSDDYCGRKGTSDVGPRTSDFGLRTLHDRRPYLAVAIDSAASLAQPNHLPKYTSCDAKKPV